ncbi:MAG: GTP-binding protein [Thermodesulfobacteriota bacterium]
MTEFSIDVYLIAGFLGSGKTTLLNRMLKHVPRERKLMILMNEFGEEGIDGALIEDPELDMIEISRGSIFCACVKGDYIKALYRIAFVHKPDLLVMEASGVANPTDLERDLANPVYKGVFSLKEKFCLIDADNFLEQFEIFYALEKQIASTDRFIINKVDLADRETIAKSKKLILELNPSATFVETTFAQIDFDEMFPEKAGRGMTAPSEPVAADELLSEADLESVVDQILDDEAAQVTPPDRLMSITCRWIKGSMDQFRAVAEKIPADVVRAKGFVFDEGKPFLYSHVGKAFEIGPFEGPTLANSFMNRVVFIRRELLDSDIRSLFDAHGITLL